MLARLGDVKDPESVTMLAPFLADETLSAEAAAATLSIVEAFIPARCQDARPPLERVLAAPRTPEIRQRAELALKRLEEIESFVTDWWVAGPYTHAARTGQELFDQPFPPEEPGATGIAWRKQPLADDPNGLWAMDLHATMPGDHRAGYLWTRVYSPKTQPVRLDIGSDDGVKVWLNGKVVHSNNALRGLEPGADKIDIALNEGWNTLLLKVTNNDGAWSACAAIRTPAGGKPAGVYAAAGEVP